MKKRTRGGLTVFVLFLGIQPVLHADSSAADCLQRIQAICAGQEDHLETCLTQKSDRFSTECRDLLQNAISQAQNGTGVGACMDDIKTFCNGMDAASLTQCLTEKYAQFSPACQKNLEATNAARH